MHVDKIKSMLTSGAESLRNCKVCLSNVDAILLRFLCISKYKTSQPHLRVVHDRYTQSL
jgi:hypothetical protein